MAQVTTPAWSTYWPSGVNASSFEKAGINAAYPFLKVDTATSYKNFVDAATKLPNSDAAKLSAIFGGPEKYKAAADAYNLTNLSIIAEAKPSNTNAQLRLERAQKNLLESAVGSEELNLPVAKPSATIQREQSIANIRTQLENQYNNLVQLDPNAAYKGRTSDLPAIFNQQAAQLADAGVTSITNLKIQDGKLVDSSTGKIVSTSNLGGQVSVDRDTGVQKWGDIFSGVEGGANYGISALEDGSVVLFPAWEKSKSLMQQVVQSDLFKVGSLALAAYGLYNLGTTLASAGGAEALTAAGAEAGMVGTPGVSTVYPVAAPNIGVSSLAPQAVAAGAGSIYALPSGSLTPGSVPYSELTYVPPASPGLPGTVAGLEAPGLSSMGGGTGLLAPVSGGVVSEMGFVPTGATPALGDPSSFINDPNLLYGDTPGAVISEDYLSTNLPAAASGLGIKDVLNMARTGMQLFGGQQQGLLGGGYGGGGQTAAGVDYSGLLSLLQGKARTPGVSSLIAPVASPVASPYEPLLGQQPQYQSLLGRTQQSLLG